MKADCTPLVTSISYCLTNGVQFIFRTTFSRFRPGLAFPGRVLSRIGAVKIYAQNCLQAPADLKSASNRGVGQSCLQMLHVHVLLVAPLGVGYMAQPRADQHQGGVTVRECPHHPRPTADRAGTAAVPAAACPCGHACGGADQSGHQQCACGYPVEPVYR